ncbi:Flp/Fap pilin component [Rubripirellula obstinata]|uniref:Flp/Fap pilin component n=1 Tax=Rubripirellula obstinata TaxID=406547 RepID=A0A5B1CJ05_9BACT|nr:Flp family type IVb pilin [Rubripirellula obstinata]KAA1260586.1 Flp/Fap pilin component [Rubripirellula obstinata]
MSLLKRTQPIIRFLVEEDGATAVEYAVLIALILGTLIGSALLLGPAVDGSFKESSDAISGAFGS